jgi:hypothetical protein
MLTSCQLHPNTDRGPLGRFCEMQWDGIHAAT